MSDYESRMRERLIADHARFMSRQEREDALLRPTDDSRASLPSYHGETPLLRGIGMIPQSDTRRKTPRRAPRTRVVGVAAFSTDPEHIARLASGDVNPTMLVTRDGISTVVEVTRRGTASRKNRTVVVPAAPTVDTARFALPADTFQQ